MRKLIVTAANEDFVPLLRDLLDSLEQWKPRPFDDIGLLDLDLSPASAEWARQRGVKLVKPGWDLPVAAELRQHKPYLRAFTARPFLPDHFPGYDLYLWIDADAWVQERYALDWYFAAARRGALAITPQVDRAYRHTPGSWNWRAQRLDAYYGAGTSDQLRWATYVNSGVFALRGDAPHWKAWARHFSSGLQSSVAHAHCDDQTALNHALWTERLAVHALPALCNWACHLARPRYDAAQCKLREPLLPHQAIGIIHLTGKTKELSDPETAAPHASDRKLRFARRQPTQPG